MMETPGYGSQIAQGVFKIRSQTDPSKHYEVKQDGDKLVCSCPDHFKRNADCKHIHTALEMIKKKRCYANEPVRILERSKIPVCKHCDSGRIKKAGVRKNKKGTIQRYACLDCKKRFTANFGFEKMRYDSRTITQALQMYYQGMSVRDIECNLEMVGIDVDHSSIYDWITKYSTLVSDYIEGIVPRTNDRTMVRADEVWIKVKGEYKYLFASMDDDTRYWLASEMAHTKFQHNADTLLQLTKKKIGKSPAHFVTDGLPAYDSSSVKVFGKVWYTKSSSPPFDMVLLSCLLVNHDFSSGRHLACKRLNWSLIFSVHAKRHVRPPVVVLFHEQIHRITLAHHYRLEFRQLALDLPVQSLQLAVCLRVLDALRKVPDAFKASFVVTAQPVADPRGATYMEAGSLLH